MINKYVIGGLVCLLSLAGISQDCNDNLEEARRAYYNGEFEKVTQLLDPCISEYSSKSMRVSALELLAKSRLMLNEDSIAAHLATRILITDPNYETEPSTLRSYRDLVNRFKLIKSTNIGIEAGMTQPDFIITGYHSYGSRTLEPNTYDPSPGINVGIWGAQRLRIPVYIRAGVYYQTARFYQQEIIQEYQAVSSDESYAFLNIPVQLELARDFGKWTPFVNAGYSFQHMLSARADIALTPLQPDFPSVFTGTENSVSGYNLLDQRNKSQWNFVAGAGVRYCFGRTSLGLSVNFQEGTENLTKAESRYSKEELYRDYSYVYDDFRMNQWVFNISFIYSILKAKEYERIR